MPRRTAIVAGFVNDGLGLGEAARGYADALATAGWDVRQHAVALPGRPSEPGLDADAVDAADVPFATADDSADVLLLCVNPPELDAVLTHDVELPSATVHVASWAWEVDPVPASWSRLVDRFDAVWAYSDFVRDLLSPATTGRVRIDVVPPPVRAHAMRCAAPAAEPKDVFLTIADAASGLVRKNPEGAIDAFCAAFAPGEGPRLVVKVWDNGSDHAGMDRLRRRVKELDRGDIEVLDRFLPRRELAGLVASSAALVSLHRSEGFGLPIVEALAAGVPVVTSACGGAMDVVDDEVAFLVDVKASTVPDGTPYPVGSRWFDPSIDDAAQQLRRVWTDRQEARRRAESGRQRVARALSVATVGARMDDALRRLLPLPDAPAVPSRRWHRARPTASVVVHAVEPWPALRPFLDAVVPQVRELGGELVVAASDPGVLPDEHLRPRVRRVDVGESSPYALRAAGLRAATGELLVVTEDHSLPHPGWLAAYWRAHLDTGAGLLAGPVGSGSTSTRGDWANYLVNFASFAPPIDASRATGPFSRLPTIANCAVGRAVFDGGRGGPDGAVRPEWFERELVRHLHLTDQTVLVPDARVDHVQPFPFWRHLRHHVDDSRCAGAHTAAIWPEAVVRLHPRDLRDRTRELLRDVTDSVKLHPDLHEVHHRAAWHLRALAFSRTVAQAVGARWGAGRSADRLD